MADLQSSPVRQPGAWRREPLQVQQGGGKVSHRLHEHAPNPTQFVGFLTLIVSGGILLLLTGLTVIGLVMGLIVFTPLLLISSPIWIPAGIFLFVGIAWTLSMCGFAVAVLSAMSWLYRCLKGFNPLGSSRVDYAQSQISNTTSHMKDYARGYGGHWQSKVKDAAPSA